jgi:CARDB
MQKRAIVIGALSALALALTTASVGAMGLAARSRPAAVRLVQCGRSDGDGWSAAFYARMRRIRHTGRMALRYTLLERTGDEPFHGVYVPGLRRWHRSQSGVAAFALRQRVRNLERGSAYRARVDFRWYGADSTLIAKARRWSRACQVPGRLANLRVVGLSALPGAPAAGRSTYLARVANTGRAAADNVAVSMSVDGAALGRATIARIGAGQTAEASFVGPRCSGGASLVTATADPDYAIPEYSERDNRLTAGCGSIGGP